MKVILLQITEEPSGEEQVKVIQEVKVASVDEAWRIASIVESTKQFVESCSFMRPITLDYLIMGEGL